MPKMLEKIKKINGFSKAVIRLGIKISSLYYLIAIIAYISTYRSQNLMNSLLIFRSAYSAAPGLLAAAVTGALICDIIYTSNQEE